LIVNISDILAAGRMMKALNPEHVIPGHGPPITAKLFDDVEKYYALLVDRVTAKVKEGRSLDDIMKEVKMPEYAGCRDASATWSGRGSRAAATGQPKQPALNRRLLSSYHQRRPHPTQMRGA